MYVDLAAGSRYRALPAPLARRSSMAREHDVLKLVPPKILVFDSGLGGLTVHAEIAKLRPDATLTYAADDAGFPYGRWAEADLVAHVLEVLEGLIAVHRPDVCVIACNTASTLVLPVLRARFADLPFVGTVPAIKPAAALSRTRLISVLATPGTVARDYTRALIDTFAADCAVTLVGSTRLAGFAEAEMAGERVPDAAIAAEIAPCFVEANGARTDVVALACTHYPLLRDRFAPLAPWPVAWIDPAPAIARRVDSVLRELGFDEGAPRRAPLEAIFTSGRPMTPVVGRTLRACGLPGV